MKILSYFSGMIIDCFEGLYGSDKVMDIMANYDDMFLSIMGNNVFKAIIATIATIALSLIIVYWLIDLADKISANNISMQQMFRSMVLLFIAFCLITKSMDIIKLFVQLGNALAQEITETDAAAKFFRQGNHAKMFQAGLGYIDLGDSIGIILRFLLPVLLVMVSNIVITFIAVSRVVELVVRAAFAPAALADTMHDFGKSTGVRYLKKILALCLQIAMCVMISSAVSLILKNAVGAESIRDMTNLLKASGDNYYTSDSILKFLDAFFGDHYWLCMGLCATKIALLFKSISVANDVVGV